MNRKDRRAAGKHRPDAKQGTHGASELFALAARHHQAGQLIEAEALYRQALALDRNHFGSLHHLGIMALQRGQPQAAVEAIGQAIAVNPGVPDCRYHMAFALHAVGRPREAAAHYQEAIRLKPDYVEAHTNLGNLLRDLGNLPDAVAAYARVIALQPSAEAHYNLATTLGELGRFDWAEDQYRRALALKPDLAGAHNNLANVLVAQGRVEEALIHFQRALELAPGLVEVHVNLGAALLRQGKLAAAALQLERAVSIKPDFADAHCNLGNVYLAQGRLDEAAQRYRHALALKPELAAAYNNLGIVAAARGRHEEASRCFQIAIAREPNFVDAYNNLGRAFMALGQADNALGALRRGLTVAETPDIKTGLVQCMKMLATPPAIEDFRMLLLRALSEPWGRPRDLSRVAARAIKQDSTIARVVSRAVAAWPRRLPAAELMEPGTLAEISRHLLLRALLETAPASDLELERFLTALRFALLELVSASPADDGIRDLCCALARQCFLNEQVFAVTEDELAAAHGQRELVVAALASGAAIPEAQLALVASYFPLHSLPGAGRLLDRDWSATIRALLVQQVSEPAQERELLASLPVLTPIDDAVSREVQRQYEENPYPRWARADPPGPTMTIDQYLRQRFPAASFAALGKTSIDVLIAGCGTGQHAIETAQRFAGKVLAVDLSLASLAFALRKTRELSRTDIEYGQADILALGALGRSFDLIEASGVLHHLADPLAGWRVLASLLRPGGLMMVGLYSEIARAAIAEARAFMAERGYRATAEDIRRCRQDLAALGSRFGNVVASDDFFTTSACRDLLFHVQEHRFTLPQIADFIAAHGLAFVAFDIDHVTAGRYLARNQSDTGMTDLAAWDRFERDNPGTFSGMYQFWLQKRR